MSSCTAMIGLALYHAVNLNEDSDTLGDLLAATRARGGRELGYVQGQLTSSDRFSRQTKVTPAVLAQLQTDLRGGVFRRLVFDELSKSQQKLNDGYASLQIDLKPARSPQASSNEIALYPYRVVMLVPRKSVEHPEQLQESTLHLAATLNAPYGFVHLGGDYRDVLMEVTSTPMFPWGHEMSATDLQRQARLFHCQAKRTLLGTVTCGTYWGNLLGKHIVDRLGGAERAKQEAPVAVVVELSDGGLYLQLTKDLADPSGSGYQRALAELNEYLAPVSALHRAP